LHDGVKVEAKGGNGGTQWDDGFDYEGVTKIHVQGGNEGIQFIKFDYAKAGKTKMNICYLLRVIMTSTGVVQSIKFITNKKTSHTMGFNDGAKFLLRAARSRIVGFHGFADKNLNSLGAYFIKNPLTKSAMQGGQTTGIAYDHGGDYDGIRKVYVTFDGTQIRHIRVDYDKAGKLETHEHGDKVQTPHEFVVDYPYEYITSVEGSYGVSPKYKCDVVTSLTFKTSNGRTSGIIGSGWYQVRVGEPRQCYCWVPWTGSIGAYYNTPLPPPPPEKLEGQGGDGGDSWDDGAFLNVKKIYIGQGDVGIVSVKFEYENNASEVVVGDEHGTKTLLGYEEFELNYPSEYIISVEAWYDKVMGAETGVITMLKFKTNKRISRPFGLESASSFVLQKEGYKITGFHGKSGTVLHKIGVHVIPSPSDHP
ncbi:unnamed protein product, partial [Thlaspi arvense]